MYDRLGGDGEWSWLGCLIVIGLLICEIAGALWVLMRLLA
jgi:hypothetical protein